MPAAGPTVSDVSLQRRHRNLSTGFAECFQDPLRLVGVEFRVADAVAVDVSDLRCGQTGGCERLPEGVGDGPGTSASPLGTPTQEAP